MLQPPEKRFVVKQSLVASPHASCAEARGEIVSEVHAATAISSKQRNEERKSAEVDRMGESRVLGARDVRESFECRLWGVLRSGLETVSERRGYGSVMNFAAPEFSPPESLNGAPIRPKPGTADVA